MIGEKVLKAMNEQIKTTWNSPLESWQDAYAHKQLVTGKINEIRRVAREENDFTAEPLFNWFTNEQIKEEANTGKIASQMALLGDNQQGLYLLDRELGARPFPPGSPWDPAAYGQEG